jgi:hypothetical protein
MHFPEGTEENHVASKSRTACFPAYNRIDDLPNTKQVPTSAL